MAIGDVNGDGLDDIVVANTEELPTDTLIFPQLSSGGFGTANAVASYPNAGQPLLADMNNDGRKDLVVTHDPFGYVGLYLQQADGSLGTEQLLGGGTTVLLANQEPVVNLAAGDLNGDGFKDIAVATGAGVVVFLSRSTGAAPAARPALSAAGRVVGATRPPRKAH